MTKVPEQFREIYMSASLIAKEMWGIQRQVNRHFELYKNEVFMIGFGYGPKGTDGVKPFFIYWVWYKDKPYGGLMPCILKTKYDAIDYYQTALLNAKDTIDAILNENPAHK